MANDMPDTPATPDRRRGIPTVLAVVALYSTGYALGHALLPLLRPWFTPAGH